MSTTELIELIRKLPSDKQKEVEDIVQSMIANTNKEPQKKLTIEIKPGFGGGKGIFGYMADDFDGPLKEFHDYMYHINIGFIDKIEKLPVEQQQKIEASVDAMLEKATDDNQ